MNRVSFDRLLKSSRLAMPMTTNDALIVDRSIRLTRPDHERVEQQQAMQRLSNAPLER